MKHIEIIPDCPKCGREMTIVNKGNEPYTSKAPWGSSFTAWYRCCSCGYESEKFTAKHKDEAKKLADEACGAKRYTEKLAN